MSVGVNRFRADLRDIKFQLFEHFRLQELFGGEAFEDWDQESTEMVLGEVYKWVCDKLGPINANGDREGCTLKDGSVFTPKGFKQAWDDLNKVGWRLLSVAEEHGGQGGPYAIKVACGELMTGANTSFSMYPGLAEGVAKVLEGFGTEEQVKKFVGALHDGTLGGTMCLTEPHAGSDVGANSTKATKRDDGQYLIEGTKIFISGGDQDLTDNIIHLVLARTADAPSGTKGLSLFIVPKNRLDDGSSNHVVTASIEHKMGINGSSTCVLNFGEGGDCLGELVGTVEQNGIKQMFKMMNGARIEVGIQGLGVASSAYLNALDYAKERKQGPSVRNWKDPDAPKVAIIEHPDVRRMLLDMKAKVEGIRALAFKLATHVDREQLARGNDDTAADYHKGQVDLLVPLVKAYASDQAFEISATAIQVFGGAGFLGDHPVEQYCRDAKIFSIYEGTNHIQALDLVGRKLGQKGGANFQAYLKDMGTFVEKNKEHPVLKDAVALLGKASGALGATAMRFLGWFQSGGMELVPLSANRFLEMMSQTTVAWLLLEAAALSIDAVEKLDDDHPDHAFYDGKRYAALFYAHRELPRVIASSKSIEAQDRSALDIPDGAF